MATYPQRRDTIWIWVIAGGGLALVAILFALVLGAVALIWVMAVMGELRQVYTDWKVRRMARARQAELREAGSLK